MVFTTFFQNFCTLILRYFPIYFAIHRKKQAIPIKCMNVVTRKMLLKYNKLPATSRTILKSIFCLQAANTVAFKRCLEQTVLLVQ
jgi:hypothetical protein